jgi:MFS family permease
MDRRFIRDKSTFLAYLMLAFYGYCLNIFGPITPFLKAELALSYTVSGFHFSAFAAGIIAAGFAGPRVIRTIGGRKALWLGAFGLCAGAILVAVGRHPALTIAASFLMGLIGSLVLSVVPVMLTDRHGEDRTVAFLEANVVASIVSAAAPLLVGLFASTALGWRAALVIAPLFPIAMRLGFGKIDLPQVSRESAPRETRRPLAARYWAFWLAIVLSVSIEFCMVFWSADFFVNVRGMQKATASQSVTVFLAGMVLGRLAAGRVVRRFSPHALVTACILIAAAGFLMFWISPNPVLGAAARARKRRQKQVIGQPAVPFLKSPAGGFLTGCLLHSCPEDIVVHGRDICEPQIRRGAATLYRHALSRRRCGSVRPDVRFAWLRG